jgi:hypothetical protein
MTGARLIPGNGARLIAAAALVMVAAVVRELRYGWGSGERPPTAGPRG